MGTTGSASAKDFPAEEVGKVAVDVLSKFTPLYISSYTDALVEAVQREANPGSNAKYKLHKPPLSSEPVHEGWLTKLGAIKKTWKRRYFVAMNHCDNFVIYYFTKEEFKTDPSLARGCISLCGYRVRRMRRPAERKEFGELALCLFPADRRRTWYVRCESTDDRKMWQGVFQHAASNTEPPLSVDTAERRAFEDAYRRTRWQFGGWDEETVDVAEPQMLTRLAVSQCQPFIAPLLEKIPQGKNESKDRAALLQLLDDTAGTSVTAGWNACVSVVGSNKVSIEKQARATLPDILAKREAFRSKTRAAMKTAVTAKLDALLAPILAPVTNSLVRPLYKAHRELVKVFFSKVAEIIDTGITEADLRYFARDVRWYWGVLNPAYVKVRALTREGDDGATGVASADAASILMALSCTVEELIEMLRGVTLAEVEGIFERGLRETILRAIYTFTWRLEQGGVTVAAAETAATKAATADGDKAKRGDGSAGDDGGVDTGDVKLSSVGVMREMLAEVTTTLIEDCKTQCRESMMQVFRLVLMPELRQHMEGIAEDHVPTLAKDVPDALAVFLDARLAWAREVDRALEQSVESHVWPLCEPMLARLDKLPGKLGFGAAKVAKASAAPTAAAATATGGGAGAGAGAQ